MATTSVRVITRFRPVNSRERKEAKQMGKLDFDLKFNGTNALSIRNKNSAHEFTFDQVFNTTAQQPEVYERAAKKVIEDVLNGYNGTIFAYGQTGSGKTFTMFGPDECVDSDLLGIIPRASAHIFDHIEADTGNTEYTIRCSFLEIYMENIRDLLTTTKKNLRIRESPEKGIYVEGLVEEYVSDPQDIADLIMVGNSQRKVAATGMNADSSRSHSVFIIQLEQKTEDGSTKTGKLNLVDLAGSEKVGKTGATGETLEEAKKINQSLSALGNCIHALTESKRGHIPYRDSRLTRILQESLGGNTKTTLLITCSPHPFNFDETVSTLKFGARAKTIKNEVKINQQKSAAELQRMVDVLTKQLQAQKKYATSLEKQIEWMKSSDYDPSKPIPDEYLASPVSSKESGGSDDINQDISIQEQVTLERLQESTNCKIRELQDDLAEMTAQFEEAQLRVKEFKRLNDKLSMELEISKKHRLADAGLIDQEDRKKLHNEELAQSSRMEELVGDLAAANAELAELRVQVNQKDTVESDSKADTGLEETKRMKEKCIELEEENNMLVDLVAHSESKLQAIQLQQEQEQLKTTNGNFQNEEDLRIEHERELQEVKEKSQQQLSTLKEELSQLKDKLYESQEKEAKAIDKFLTTKEKLAGALSRIPEAERSEFEMKEDDEEDGVVLSLQKELHETLKKIDGITNSRNQEMEELAEKLRETQKEVQQVEREKKQVEVQLKDVSNRIDILNEQVNVSAESKQKQQELFTKRNEALALEVEELRVKLEYLEGQNSGSSADELRKVKADFARVTAIQKDQKERLDSKNEKILELQMKLDEAERSLHARRKTRGGGGGGRGQTRKGGRTGAATGGKEVDSGRVHDEEDELKIMMLEKQLHDTELELETERQLRMEAEEAIRVLEERLSRRRKLFVPIRNKGSSLTAFHAVIDMGEVRTALRKTGRQLW